MMPIAKWIIVSNRLPLQFDGDQKKLSPSTGGLVTAVKGIKTKHPITWVGAASRPLAEHLTGTGYANGDGKPLGYHPVVIEEDLFDRYYNGYCNDALWPLLHYESERVHHLLENWEAYVAVNRRFAQEISRIADSADLIWIHDFHLFLVPTFLKKLKKPCRVGFFLHVPFPTSEIFRQLPNSREILASLLKADLVGFHDYAYLRHFTSSVYTILGIDADMYSINHEGHSVRLGVFPVGIDTPGIKRKATSAAVGKELERLGQHQPTPVMVLGVDRLDYIKGIDLKFRAFERLLELYPAWRGKVWLVQIAVPSRTDVEDYRALRSRLEEMVGSINGRFGDISYNPVHYIFSSIPLNQLLALYRRADTLMVTSKRDGMNLVCLEYIASQDADNPGNLLLSEFAGAISNLSHVTPINPWDTNGTAHALNDSLKMSRSERIKRHQPMMAYLRSYTASKWAESFMVSLERRTAIRQTSGARSLKPRMLASTLQKKMGSRHLLIFMDFDGTLVPIKNRPEDAILETRGKRLLASLVRKRQVRIVVTSGRPRNFLEEQLGKLGVEMAAEHGASFYDPADGQWTSLVTTDLRWYKQSLAIMEDFASRVPDSFVEQKEYGLCFHYRNSPKDFGQYQANRLHSELEMALTKMPVTILEGKKNVEVRSIEANKGYFCRWFLHKLENPENYLTLAIGDDRTDEDMFMVALEYGHALKVGDGTTLADFHLPRQELVLDTFQELANLLK